MYNIEELRIRLLSELKEIAEELGVKNYKSLKKEDLVYAILDQQAITPEKSLPKKKPSKTETEEDPKVETAPKAENSTQEVKENDTKKEEKPKFRRQNVTEIAKESENKSQDQSKSVSKPEKDKKEEAKRPEKRAKETLSKKTVWQREGAGTQGEMACTG
jgi:transcription termination factor Rho